MCLSHETSELRLFLSVDISGSTKLKNLRNHQRLLKRKKEITSIIESFDKRGYLNKNFSDIDVTSLYFDEDPEWADAITNLFDDFHQGFVQELSNFRETVFPWKIQGDELIYSFPVTMRKELHDFTLAFLKCLRKHDNKLSKSNVIRLKGTAWVAGFPVKNRKIHLKSIPKLFYKNENNEDIPFPYPTEDYLGPDMDIGFRLGKSVSPGFIVVSIELLYLLGQYETSDQILTCKVGWEKLKGVWGERPYPIFWLCLPQRITNASHNDYTYEEHCPWEENENLIKGYFDKKKEKNILEVKKFIDEIENIISKLPEELGVVRPYIFSEDKKRPPLHDDILNILQMSTNHVGIRGSQETRNNFSNEVNSISIDEKKKEISNLFTSHNETDSQ